jgi:hypothetical protein
MLDTLLEISFFVLAACIFSLEAPMQDIPLLPFRPLDSYQSESLGQDVEILRRFLFMVVMLPVCRFLLGRDAGRVPFIWAVSRSPWFGLALVGTLVVLQDEPHRLQTMKM